MMKMIQILPSYQSDQALGVGVLPWALKRCQHLAMPIDFRRLAINAIPIADQITRYFAIGESLDNLLCNPKLRLGVRSNCGGAPRVCDAPEPGI
jgi:hypothetical protein